MTLTIKHGNGTALVAPDAAALDFQIDAHETSVVISSASETEVTNDDAVFLSSTDAVTDNQFEIDIRPTDADETQREQITVAIDGPATLTGNTITRNGDGNVAVIARHPWKAKRIDLVMQRTGGQTVETYVSHVAGSLGRAIHDAVDALVATSQDLDVFTTIDNGNPTYTRNPSCWVTADKTCWPVYRNGINKYCGALISPRHMIAATHAPPSGTMRFVTNDNQIVERTVTGGVNVGDFDLRVCVLNADVPASITPAKVLPKDYGDYMPTRRVPMIMGNQRHELVLREAVLLDYEFPSVWYTRQTEAANRIPLTKPIIGGDSGSPIFLLINGELVVTGCHHTALTSPSLTYWFDEVNAAMTTLGGGYQLTPIDLSSFTNYGD